MPMNTEPDAIIYAEMMSHPALFVHPHPQQIAVIGHADGLAQELLKHPGVKTIFLDRPNPILATESRVQIGLPTSKNSLDILIIAAPSSDVDFANYATQLTTDGILVQQSDSPFELTPIAKLRQALVAGGFKDIQLLQFPQPHFPSGWRCAFIAKKSGVFKRIREKDVFNKPFTTHYYNFDIHRAALAVPEFLREEILA